MKNKSLIFFSAGRSDFSLIEPIINFFKLKKFQVSLVCSGNHNNKKFGLTKKEIDVSKIKISFISKNLTNKTDISSIFKVILKSSDEYFNYLNRKKPDAVFVLGDRYEVLSFVLATYFLNIPIVHMHGGEITEGAFDDGIRHSISKLSNLHFVINKKYRQRLVNMGEQPNTVYNVGSIVEESLKNKIFLKKKQLFEKYKIKNQKTLIITFHPETRTLIPIQKQIKCLLLALARLQDNINIIFTYNNPDTGGLYFISKIKEFMRKRKNVHIFSSMGQELYWNFLKISDVLVGNSSSGIIEAPFLKIPTLNIGDRQKGRIFTSSIYSCEINTNQIYESIIFLLYKKKINYTNCFKKKNTILRIYNQTMKFFTDKKFQKKFYDIKKNYK